MKPSDFKRIRPIGSVLQKSEAETVILNIIIILSRTGDEWRNLSYQEYKNERLKDGNYSDREQEYFNQVISYTISPEKAKLFCKQWELI